MLILHRELSFRFPSSPPSLPPSSSSQFPLISLERTHAYLLVPLVTPQGANFDLFFLSVSPRRFPEFTEKSWSSSRPPPARKVFTSSRSLKRFQDSTVLLSCKLSQTLPSALRVLSPAFELETDQLLFFVSVPFPTGRPSSG